MKQEINYPKYFKCKHCILAFVAKDKMFKLAPIGSNKNPGLTLDHYTTRTSVLNQWPKHDFKEITETEFIDLYKKFYNAYLEKLLSWPK